MTRTATLTPARATHILRVHPAGGMGLPYDAAGTVTIRDGVAEIQGFVVEAGRFTAAHWRAIQDALTGAGVREVVWERGGGRSVRVEIDAAPEAAHAAE